MDRKAMKISQEVEKRLEEIFNETEPVEQLFDDIPETIEETDFIDDYSTLRRLKSIILSIDWEIKDEYLIDLIDESERLKEEYKNDKPLALMFQMLISIGKYLQKKKTHAHPDAVTVLKSIFEGIERILTNENIHETEKEEEFSRKLEAFNALKAAIQEQSRKPKKEEKPEEKIIEKIEFKEEPVAIAPEYIPFEYRALQEKEAPIPEKEEVTPEKPEIEGEKFVPTEDIIEAERQKLSIEKEETIEESFVETKVMEPHEAFLYALEEIKEVIRSEFRAIRAELRLWRESQQR